MEKPGYLRHKAGPVSLEAERQRAMKIVHRIETDTEKFNRNWLMDATDDFVDEWLSFIEFAKTQASMKKCSTYEAFGEELKRMKTHVAMTEKRKDIEQMERVVGRAKLFDDIAGRADSKLRKVLDSHIAKFCLSFAYEANNQDLTSVIEYENNINEWTENVRCRLDRLRIVMADLEEQEGGNIEIYIRNYGKVLHYMGLVLEIIPQICNTFKDWVIADEIYIKKVQSEMETYQYRKNELVEIVRRRQNRKPEIRSKIIRAGFESKRINEHMHWTISERRQCRKRELSYQDEIDILEEDIEEKQHEYEKFSDELSSKKKLSDKEQNSLVTKMDLYAHDIVEMKQRLKKMKNKLNKMKINRYDVQKDLYKTKRVFEKSVKGVKRIKTRAKVEETTTEKIIQEIKILTSKINALNRIVKLKSNPMTVKRIHYEGYLPGRNSDLSDHLSEALKLTALGVGKDWAGLYERLPFDPPRDKPTRKHDIDVIDFKHNHTESDMRRVALQGLEKWRRLSNKASTNALVRTLRSIEKQKVADTLERQVIVN